MKLNNVWDIIRHLAEVQPIGFLGATAAILAAFIALIGVFYTVQRTKRNIKMQARIDWIQEVRKQTAEFITGIVNITVGKNKVNLIRYYQEEGCEKGTSEYNLYNHEVIKIHGEMEDRSVNFWNKGQILSLYFADIENINENLNYKNYDDRLTFLKNVNSNKNKNFYIVEFIRDILKNFESDRKGEDVVTPLPEDYLEDFREIISIYLKIEWDIAKKGK